MKKFFKNNIFIILYFVIVCIIELLGVFVTSGKFYIKSPLLFLLIQAVFICILLSLSSQKARHIASSIFISIFFVMNMLFIVLFDMTETLFDYGMFNLRNDAMSILESIPIDFLFFSVCALMLSCYIVFGARFARHNPNKVGFKYTKIITTFVLIFTLAGNGFTLYFNNKNFQSKVTDKLYRTNDATYADMGITANFFNELFKGTFFFDVPLGDEEQLNTFIYDKVSTSNFSENAGNYNLVTMLVESFEWFSFMQDFELFVNGHNIINPQTNKAYTEDEANAVLEKLFPNIYDFYKSSISLTNFYSREKTDISENLCLTGSYPTGAYINYDFPANEIVSSMPSTLKTLYGDNITCNAFHNGFYTYYNRNESILSLGFDSFTASEQMHKKGLTDWDGRGERNLDSQMIEVCSDEMFPTDKQFYTHITTITMHGQYTYRENLEQAGYYDEMAQYGIKAKSGNTAEDNNFNIFYYYTACVKEFDKALGITMSELKERSLDDNTIVLIFGDHNTYYQNLSNSVKDIENTDNKNFTNLYRVPCMINYPNITQIVEFLETEKYDQVGTRYIITENEDSLGNPTIGIQVKKFACTSDMLPTLFDLLGINYYENLYFGHSIFSSTQSVLYSRAYDVFVTDCLYFSSLKNIKWSRDENTSNDPATKYADLSNYSLENHLQQVETEASILLTKLDACNRIYFNNYFAKQNINSPEYKNYEIYATNLKNIN